MREKVLQGPETRRSPVLMAGMWVPIRALAHSQSHLHHDTRIHTRPPPSAALDSCTFNKSAEIQLLRPLLCRGARQLSRTGNYPSPRQGGNRSFWEKVHTRTHSSPTPRCCELLADCITASWEQSRAPPGVVWTGQTFLFFFLSFSCFLFSYFPSSPLDQAAWEGLQRHLSGRIPLSQS